MKGRTKKSEEVEAKKKPRGGIAGGALSPLGMSNGGSVMVGGAKRSKKMYQGGSMGTKGTARGMGAAVKGGKFTDL